MKPNQKTKRPLKTQLAQLDRDVVSCNRCPRLRDYCKHIAIEKRRAYMDWDYWGKPVTGFGDIAARIWILGLAPAAHGANRTGRIFTGDRSGDFLFAALHRAGYANQPTSVSLDDGLALKDVYISASVRCAPPGNKPLPSESTNCSEYLDREWNLLIKKRVILALGKIAWDAALALAQRNIPPNASRSKTRIPFGHGSQMALTDSLTLVGSYHVSQQNTFTGTLTTEMFDSVIIRCRAISESN